MKAFTSQRNVTQLALTPVSENTSFAPQFANGGFPSCMFFSMHFPASVAFRNPFFVIQLCDESWPPHFMYFHILVVPLFGKLVTNTGYGTVMGLEL